MSGTLSRFLDCFQKHMCIGDPQIHPWLPDISELELAEEPSASDLRVSWSKGKAPARARGAEVGSSEAWKQ